MTKYLYIDDMKPNRLTDDDDNNIIVSFNNFQKNIYYNFIMLFNQKDIIMKDNDYHNLKDTPITILRFRPIKDCGELYIPLGDYITHQVASRMDYITEPITFLKYDDNNVKIVENFDKIYQDDKISLWKPNCPKGYISAGLIVMNNNEQPNKILVGCIKSKYIRKTSVKHKIIYTHKNIRLYPIESCNSVSLFDVENYNVVIKN